MEMKSATAIILIEEHMLACVGSRIVFELTAQQFNMHFVFVFQGYFRVKTKKSLEVSMHYVRI